MQHNKIVFLFFSLLLLACNQVKYPYGERQFIRLCGDCHMDDGSGVSTLYPSLSTEKVINNYKDIPCIVRTGIDDTTSVIQMLPMPQVSAVDITNITNYILQDLNKSNKEIFLQEVELLLENCNPILK